MAKRKDRDHRIGRGGQFTAPPPKGIRLAGPIPKSTQYVPPEPDADEEAAFAGLVDPGRPLQRAAGKRKTNGTALSPAQMRMRGARATDGAEDGEDTDADETEDEDDDQDRDRDRDRDQDIDGDDSDGEDGDGAVDPPPPVKARRPDAPTSHPISPFGSGTGAVGRDAEPPGTVHADSVEGVHCHKVSHEDIDRLWDWIRSDKDYGQAFLGSQFRTSLALHTFMQQMQVAEANSIALIRTIQYYEHHIGFAMLAPILAEERTALMHIYLQPAVRNQLAQWVKPLVEIARKAAPGVHLAVASPNEAYARLHRQVLKPLGFREHVMFVL